MGKRPILASPPYGSAQKYIRGRQPVDNQMGQKVALRNVDLFSSSLLANRDIHQTIKTAIRERSENIRKIIAATRHWRPERSIACVPGMSTSPGARAWSTQNTSLTTRSSLTTSAHYGIRCATASRRIFVVGIPKSTRSLSLRAIGSARHSKRTKTSARP
jgi:hypothetical protein